MGVFIRKELRKFKSYWIGSSEDGISIPIFRTLNFRSFLYICKPNEFTNHEKNTDRCPDHMYNDGFSTKQKHQTYA